MPNANQPENFFNAKDLPCIIVCGRCAVSTYRVVQ